MQYPLRRDALVETHIEELQLRTVRTDQLEVGVGALGQGVGDMRGAEREGAQLGELDQDAGQEAAELVNN